MLTLISDQPKRVDRDAVRAMLQVERELEAKPPVKRTKATPSGGRTKGVVNQWRKDRNGNWVVPKLVDEFLDWYCDPRREAGDTLDVWATPNNVARVTVSRWLEDPRVVAVLDHRFEILNGRPERVQQVIRAVHDRAVQTGDVRAAELYLRYVDKLKPARVIHEDRRVNDLSDEELRRELERAARELYSRGSHQAITGEASYVDVPSWEDGDDPDDQGAQL